MTSVGVTVIQYLTLYSSAQVVVWERNMLIIRYKHNLCQVTNYFLFCFLDLPALDKAIAIAWFLGLPAAISVLILEEITFWLLPVFNGMIFFL